MVRCILIISLMFLLAACSSEEPTGTSPSDNAKTVSGGSSSGTWRIDPGDNLNTFFECLEAEGLSLISAHRGGRYPGYPENSLETAQYVSARLPAIHEIDVATSKDGTLFLMHDDTLERTTTGQGTAKDMSWAQIRDLQLEDDDGQRTSFNPPTLERFLRWAKTTTLVQIDFKRSTRYEDVVAMINKTQTQDRVIYIAYTLAQARKLHQLAPDAMISVSVDSVSELNSVIAAGIPADHLIAFTGTREPKPRLFSFLNNQDVEVIFGTLGGRGAIDKDIAASGDTTLYTRLSRQGVDIIATDRPIEAYEAMRETDTVPENTVCGISRG